MRIASGRIDAKLAFVAVDATDLKTRETGLTGFTVYRSRNGGTATAYTTPTVAELSSANMPGVYVLTVDEDTTITAGVDEEEYVVHITHASMAPVTRAVEIFRPKITEGNTHAVDAGGVGDANVEEWNATAVPAEHTAGYPIVTVKDGTGTGEIDTASGRVAITEAQIDQIVDEVLDEDMTAHQTQGTLGQVVGDSGADADSIWGLANTNLDATVSSRASAAALSTVQADTDDIQARLPAALVGGRIDANVGAISSDAVAADNLEAEYDGTGFKSYLRRGTAQAGAAGTITLDSGASATDDLYNDLVVAIVAGTGVGQARKIRDYVGSTKVATIVPNWTTNPDATSVFVVLPEGSVWDETLADHLDAGSTGAALNAAGAAGDPWATALPGAYGAGTAGKIVGDNVNATISSRASQTSLDTLDDHVDTEVAAIKAKTDQLTFTNANKVDAAVLAAADLAQAAADKVWNSTTRTLTALGASLVQEIWDRATTALTTAGSIGKLLVDNVNATISSRASQASVDAVDDYVDTEVAAIKTKTDQLTFTDAGKVDATLQAAADVKAAVANKLADHALRRTYASARAGSDGDALNKRSLLGAIARLVNKTAVSGSTLTTYNEDDTTSTAPGGTSTIVTTAGNPITSVDPDA